MTPRRDRDLFSRKAIKSSIGYYAKLTAMPNHKIAIVLSLGLAMLAGAGVLCAQTDPASLPARDSHQGLLVAVDPYIPAGRYKEKFGKHSPDDAGIMALEVYFRNDTDSPVRLNLNTVVLLISQPGESKQKLAPMTPEEVTDMVLRKQNRDPSRTRVPLPVPGGLIKSGKGKDWDTLAGVLRAKAMSSDLLAPHSTTHGFFYFDIDHQFDLLSNARFDVPDLSFLVDRKGILFFDVDLSQAKL